MVKIGPRLKCLVVKDEDGDGEVRMYYHEPKTKRKLKFLAAGAALAEGLNKQDPEAIEKLIELQVTGALEVLDHTDGFEVPDGEDPDKVLEEYGGDYLRLLAQHAFGDSLRMEAGAGLGKSVTVSVE